MGAIKIINKNTKASFKVNYSNCEKIIRVLLDCKEPIDLKIGSIVISMQELLYNYSIESEKITLKKFIKNLDVKPNKNNKGKRDTSKVRIKYNLTNPSNGRVVSIKIKPTQAININLFFTEVSLTLDYKL